ncbi:MAG: acetyl-CoA C-acetyltransferase [Thermoplasmata archaeon]|nr:acetyl-CoA C-acetyltransferase [Thermoplasmata archaeon]
MEAYIVSACRTAIGKFDGTLKGVPVQKLGAVVIEEAVKRAGIEKTAVEEVIMGNVLQAGLGQNPARQSAIYAGIPYEAGALTVNKVCGSGMKAIMIAASEIKAGDADVIVAGGMESMDNAPYLLEKARFGYRMFDGKIVDEMVYDGLWDVYNNFHMGMTGEIIAEKYHITREEIDAFALRSNQRAVKATKEGRFRDEIVPVVLEGKKGEKTVFDKDEGPREDTSMEKLAKLKPVFKEGGVVTAGNASQISDGAAALVVMSEKAMNEYGAKPLARIHSYTFSGTRPELVMDAPVPTVKKLLAKTGLKIDDFDLIEHNEAFSSASVAIQKVFSIPDEKFNVNGGAVALGHPIGCSGARIVVTLLHEMIKRNSKLGLATVCLGGGNATAIVLERAA